MKSPCFVFVAILCCFCIEITGQTGKCTVCSGKTTVIGDITEVKRLQDGFAAGCYCGAAGAALARLRCGHLVHNECKYNVYACRLCHRPVKDVPKRKKLREYVGGG